jgi:hypothetical protein
MVEQFAASLVVGQLGAGLVTSSPGRPAEGEDDRSIVDEKGRCQ